jgi:hypothetical protein
MRFFDNLPSLVAELARHRAMADAVAANMTAAMQGNAAWRDKKPGLYVTCGDDRYGPFKDNEATAATIVKLGLEDREYNVIQLCVD